MSRSARLAGIGVLVVVALVVAAWGVANLRAGSAMSGVIARTGEASIVVRDQLGAHDRIRVDEVTAPDASWLAAYRVGMGDMPGALLGYVSVPAGVSRDVEIPIDPDIRLTEYAVITLNADRGARGKFEFAMDRFESSPDKPYYVGGRAVQATATVAFPEMVNQFEVPTAPVQTP
jgi:hypothetical protein